MSNRWYILRSKPNREDFLWGQVLACQTEIEIYYPVVHVKPINPRARKFKPYFPGYLFVHVDLQKISPSFFRWLPGSYGLVAFDGMPPTVPDVLISAIKDKVNEINQVRSVQAPVFKQGDRVTIKEGPFAEYQAIFDKCISGNDRVRVLINCVRDERIPVELPVEQITNNNYSSIQPH